MNAVGSKTRLDEHPVCGTNLAPPRTASRWAIAWVWRVGRAWL